MAFASRSEERSAMNDTRAGRHYQEELGEAYFRWWSRTFGHRAHLEARKFASYVQEDSAVLDFGCGNGLLLKELGHTGLGVDPNAAARRDAADRGIKVVESTSEIPSETIDVVISNHALEHTLSPFDELAELLRVLRPSGQLVAWLPLDDWRSQAYGPRDGNHHLFAWTPRSLANLLTEVGFHVEACRVARHAWPPKVDVLSRLPQNVFDVLCGVTSVLLRRRQLAVTARRPLASRPL